METIARTEIYRVDLSGMNCRSTEKLIAMLVQKIEGIRAVSVDADGKLIAVASSYRDLYPEIVAAVVSAGLLPEAVSVGPVFRRPDSQPLTLQQAVDLGVVEPPRKPVRAEVATVQRVSVTVTDGYDPDTIIVAAGVPVCIAFSEGHGCLGEVVFEGLGIQADLTHGGAIVDLPALEPGTYPFSCGMRMVHGRVIAE